MERDMELVRELLLLIETTENSKELMIPESMDKVIVAHHLKLMEQAGLVKDSTKWASNSPMWIMATLTWNGHEYLDALRNDTVWNKLKDEVKEKGFQLKEIPFELVKKYAFSIGERLLDF